jgi:hypothetical protein
MAKSGKNVCVMCHAQANISCSGCGEDFCHQHFAVHRQKLEHEFDQIMETCDIMKQELQQTRNDSDYQSNDDILVKTHNLTKELLETHYMEDFNEFDLRQWKQSLEQLRSEITNNRSFGVPFVDISDTNGYKRVPWSTTAPKWRKVVRGMCLEGFCSNKTYEAYGQRVVIGVGMGEFDLLADPSPSTTTCPMCKKYVEPTTQVDLSDCRILSDPMLDSIEIRRSDRTL